MVKTSYILILLCLALGALVWLDNFGGSDPASAPPPPVRSAPGSGDGEPKRDDAHAAPGQSEGAPHGGTAVGNPLAAIDRAALRNTIDRPLFAPSRSRPPAVIAERVEAAVAPPEPPPPSYALLGVVHNDGRAIALLRRVADGTSFRVELGDTIGGWRVADVAPMSVRLERRDGTSRTVHLREEKKSEHGANSPDAAGP